MPCGSGVVDPWRVLQQGGGGDGGTETSARAEWVKAVRGTEEIGLLRLFGEIKTVDGTKWITVVVRPQQAGGPPPTEKKTTW